MAQSSSTEDVSIAELGKNLCHYVSLVSDLETQLSTANRKQDCLQRELEEQQKCNVQAVQCIRKWYERCDKAERELAIYKASAGIASEDITGKQDQSMQCAKIEIARLEQKNSSLLKHIESAETQEKTQEFCKYRKRIEELEKQNSALRQKNSDKTLNRIAVSSCEQLDEEPGSSSLRSLQWLMDIVKGNCCELKCRLGYTMEKTGVQESRQDQGDQVVPMFSPTNQVICEETDQGNSVEEFLRSRNVDKNDCFYYIPTPPPMCCPSSPWADVSKQIRCSDFKRSLKKVKKFEFESDEESQCCNPHQSRSNGNVKKTLTSSKSLPALKSINKLQNM